MSSTFTRPFLSIVVPAYNEEKRLGATLSKITAYLDTEGIDAEILVVDDGSKDNTAQLAAKALEGRRGRVIRNGENQGKGYSVRHGVLEARGRFVLLTDADLSTILTSSSGHAPCRSPTFRFARAGCVRRWAGPSTPSSAP
jgi:glycosyltransferase involved in cell wall biosynthesis